MLEEGVNRYPTQPPHVEQQNGVAIVGLNSLEPLDVYTTMSYRSGLIDALNDPTNTAVVADISNCEFIDAAGLAALTSALKLSRQLKKAFVIDNTGTEQAHIMKAFTITGLDKLFQIVVEKPQP